MVHNSFNKKAQDYPKGNGVAMFEISLRDWIRISVKRLSNPRNPKIAKLISQLVEQIVDEAKKFSSGYVPEDTPFANHP